MTRKDELLKIFEKSDRNILTIVSPMVDELIFVEDQLIKLKKYPFIKINPSNPGLQKTTPAGKLYKDLLAQQKDIVRILCSQLNKANEGETESPLRKYLSEWEFR